MKLITERYENQVAGVLNRFNWKSAVILLIRRNGRLPAIPNLNMPEKSDYYNISREELRKYSVDSAQLASCSLSSLEDGNGRGMKIIDVNNGSGLSFTVVPDRGMDIVELL